jgi:viroplasmin and RNaseH domain-containing protein
MKPIIVMVAQGKGRENADYITVKLFTTKEDAEMYIEKINDLESKYWTYAEIVHEGSRIEPWYGKFYKFIIDND